MSASAASSSSEGEARRRGKVCVRCSTARAQLRRPKNRQPYCKECFFQAFEEEVHDTIIGNHLFTRGDRVAVGASGGKDSTVLAYVLNKLNKEHEYGVELLLLSVDEGITGYRDDSLETVEHNRDAYGLPLTIVSYKDLYGWTMDEIVAEIGRKNNCTFCGVFRRQALDRGAHHLSATKIATGHNADDIAETVIMNVLRGDIARLRRCTAIETGSDGELPRCKPFKYAYEKEIVLYAHFRQLEYFSTECVYSPYAYRGFAREFIKDLEAADPHSILDIIHAGETMTYARMPADRVQVKQSCTQCGFISSNALCQACQLLQSLNAGLKGQRAKRPDRVQVGYTEG